MYIWSSSGPLPRSERVPSAAATPCCPSSSGSWWRSGGGPPRSSSPTTLPSASAPPASSRSIPPPSWATAGRGNAGGVAATLGLVFPCLLIIMFIAAFLQNFAHLSVAVHAFNGVRACVCALILSSVLKLRKSTVVDRPTAVLYAVVLALAARGPSSPLRGAFPGECD